MDKIVEHNRQRPLHVLLGDWRSGWTGILTYERHLCRCLRPALGVEGATASQDSLIDIFEGRYRERCMERQGGLFLLFSLPPSYLTRVIFDVSAPRPPLRDLRDSLRQVRCHEAPRTRLLGVVFRSLVLSYSSGSSTHSNSFQLSHSQLCRVADQSDWRDTGGIRYPQEIVYHPHAPARTVTGGNSPERIPSVDPKHHLVVRNLAAVTTSQSPQSFNLHSLQAAVAATGNRSNTPLTSRTPRFYRRTATTSSSFSHTAVAFPIDALGASCVTVPDNAAPKKVRTMTVPSAVVVRGTDCVKPLPQTLSLFPFRKDCASSCCHHCRSCGGSANSPKEAGTFCVATQARILLLSVLVRDLAESHCAGHRCRGEVVLKTAAVVEQTSLKYANIPLSRQPLANPSTVAYAWNQRRGAWYCIRTAASSHTPSAPAVRL
ncbi:hypothetical protein V8E53_004007 [Lactarius tabidus]